MAKWLLLGLPLVMSLRRGPAFAYLPSLPSKWKRNRYYNLPNAHDHPLYVASMPACCNTIVGRVKLSISLPPNSLDALFGRLDGGRAHD